MIINELKKEHFTSIIVLSNEAFGESFINEKHLLSYLLLPNYYCFVALNNNQVIGFITAKTINYNEFASSFFDNNELKECNTISIIKQVVVDKDYRNQQVASLLLNKVLGLLNKSDIIVCIAWNNNKKVGLKNILERYQFNAIQSIPNYWSADSLTHNYNCINCGKPPCRCTAELYIKKNPSIN